MIVQVHRNQLKHVKGTSRNLAFLVELNYPIVIVIIIRLCVQCFNLSIKALINIYSTQGVHYQW